MAEKKTIKLTGRQLLEAHRADEIRFNLIARRQQALQQMLSEALTAAEAVKEIEKSKKDEKMLVSLGAGVFASARLGDVKKVKSSLAGSVLINSSTEKALKELESEQKKIEKELASLQQEAQRIALNMRNIEAILQEAGKKAEKKDSTPRSVS